MLAGRALQTSHERMSPSLLADPERIRWFALCPKLWEIGWRIKYSEDFQMLSPWFGEFMGTLVLILLGDGVVAGVLLKKSKAENSGWIVITAGWAFAVLCGIFTAKAFGGSGAINPVGPIADFVTGKIEAAAMLAQVAGE